VERVEREVVYVTGPVEREVVYITVPPVREVVAVVAAGPQGPQGVQGQRGPAGDGLFDFVATSAIGGHRLLATNSAGQVVYADNTEPTHAHTLLGLSTNAAEAGAAIAVLQTGPITEPSWTWAAGQPIFLGASGLLTQTPPAPPQAAFSMVVGFALSPTEIFLTQRDPIKFGD
jgi:hypothetical protein